MKKARDKEEKRNGYLVKYALSSGLVPLEVRVDSRGEPELTSDGEAIVWGRGPSGLLSKIASLKKQIAKLEVLAKTPKWATK
jgi:hypothetical protein